MPGDLGWPTRVGGPGRRVRATAARRSGTGERPFSLLSSDRGLARGPPAPHPEVPALDLPRPTSGPERTPPPGLRAQFAATRDAAIRLAMAHVDLAKAELSAIGSQIARLLGLFAGAIALVLLALLLVVIGTTLFTAEWLLGSMGWGVIHGLLLFVGIAMAMVLAALGVSGRRIGGALVVALVVGVLASIVFGLHLPNLAYTAIGDATLPNVESGVRPLVVGALLWAVLGLLVGSWAATKVSGAGTRLGTVIIVVLAAAAIGAFTAISFGVQAGVGLGMTIGWAAWIALMALDVSRTGIDVEALQERFVPHRTIETTKETLEWLQSKMPGGTRS